MAVAGHLEQPTRGSCVARGFAAGRCGSHLAASLALLRLGVAVPPRLRSGRWALTPPFHPYPCLAAGAVCFLWPFPSPHGAQALPGSLPVGARTFLEGTRVPPRPSLPTRAPNIGRSEGPSQSRVKTGMTRSLFIFEAVEWVLKPPWHLHRVPTSLHRSTLIAERGLLFPASAPTVAAVLAPAERASLDAASIGCFFVLHRSTVPEAVLAGRERAIDAVLLSVHQCAGERGEAMDQLIRGFPGFPTVALVTRHDAAASETLLRLGANGVRQVVDVTAAAGWTRLRQLIAEPATRGAARILAPVLAALPELTADARVFLELLIRLAPEVSAVRILAARYRSSPATMMSRFCRAGLPSPKTYLAAVRLLYAAQYFEGGGRSVADVAYRDRKSTRLNS